MVLKQGRQETPGRAGRRLRGCLLFSLVGVLLAADASASSGLSVDGPAHEYHRALMAELTGGQHARLGDAILAAQATYAQSGLMPELLSVYHLLGDPAMRIQ